MEPGVATPEAEETGQGKTQITHKGLSLCTEILNLPQEYKLEPEFMPIPSKSTLQVNTAIQTSCICKGGKNTSIKVSEALEENTDSERNIINITPYTKTKLSQ